MKASVAVNKLFRVLSTYGDVDISQLDFLTTIENDLELLKRLEEMKVKAGLDSTKGENQWAI